MAYRVEFTVRAARDLDYLYQEVNAPESISAARWYNGLENAIDTLERFPHRCPLAPEGRTARLSLRHLLYGKRPRVYRVIYEIYEPQRTVRILTIRHWAMDEARGHEM